jgi:hypothetical protein
VLSTSNSRSASSPQMYAIILWKCDRLCLNRRAQKALSQHRLPQWQCQHTSTIRGQSIIAAPRFPNPSIAWEQNTSPSGYRNCSRPVNLFAVSPLSSSGISGAADDTATLQK